jgi:hypothetical protein
MQRASTLAELIWLWALLPGLLVHTAYRAIVISEERRDEQSTVVLCRPFVEVQVMHTPWLTSGLLGDYVR